MQEKESGGGSLVAHHGVVEDPVLAVGTLDRRIVAGRGELVDLGQNRVIGTPRVRAERVIRARDYDRVVGVVAAAGVA